MTTEELKEVIESAIYEYCEDNGNVVDPDFHKKHIKEKVNSFILRNVVEKHNLLTNHGIYPESENLEGQEQNPHDINSKYAAYCSIESDFEFFATLKEAKDYLESGFLSDGAYHIDMKESAS